MRARLLAVLSVTWIGSIATLAGGVVHAAAAAKSEPVILVVGDSLSAGYGIDIKQGWVTLLDERLKAQGYGYRVVNASVSGETSGGARGRLTKLLELNRPAIMILEIGANDGLRGLPVKQTRENLDVMTAEAKSAGARVLIAGMQMPPNYGAKYTEEFAAAFKDVAREQHQPLVPFFLDGIALDMKLVQADGLHPTAQAQPRILDNVWAQLKMLLKKK